MSCHTFWVCVCVLTFHFLMSARPHGVASKKVVIFIVTSVRMPNLTLIMFKGAHVIIWQLSSIKSSFSELHFPPFAPHQLQ
jgi:hypothetical protein